MNHGLKKKKERSKLRHTFDSNMIAHDNCHREGFGFCRRFVRDTWSIYRESIERYRDARCNLLSTRTKRSHPRALARGIDNAQRDSLSKSLPRIIPRKERFALLIEIEIITSAGCISWREMKRTDYPRAPQNVARSYECHVIGIAVKDHPRSCSERDQI